MNTKEQLINSIIKERRYKSYLEIGTQAGYCYNQIDCEHKIGVDPSPTAKVENQIIGTSDNFFANYIGKFDLIFIDGLHHAEQVLKDVNNSLDVLNENGTILLHDMLPTSELTQRVPRESEEWYGDCWKVAFFLLDGTCDYFDSTIHKFDCGTLELRINNETGLGVNNIDFSDIIYKNHFNKYLKLINAA